MIRLLFLLMLLSCSGSALDLQVGPAARPEGAVILVVDGLGASYVYPEHKAYALDGSPLQRAVLFNLTGRGARVVDMRVPVPETSKSHAVLVTGDREADWQSPGISIFDLARRENFLCIGILQRGDSFSILQDMDAVLYLDDNSLRGSEPIPGSRASAPAGLDDLFGSWQDRFAAYSNREGIAGYAGYNAWALDAASDTVDHLIGKPFIMLVNAGAVDSAGQNLNASGYLQTVEALDAPLGRLVESCRKNNVLLIITADHGMVFPDENGKGGHSADKYSSRPEALRVPLVILGAGVEEINLGGRWTQMSIAPTLLELLNISCVTSGMVSSEICNGISSEVGRASSDDGDALPVRESYTLQVLGAPQQLQLWQNGLMITEISGNNEYRFLGLARGLYTLKAGQRSWDVLVDGDKTLDLSAEAELPPGLRRVAGIILILIINLAGTLIILRIWRRGD